MKVTVFTPTFNRARLLPRVFESLCAQTCSDFEWLIVDDGSSDNTREIVSIMKENARFPIRYFWKTNGGKHTAYNEALKHARGEWFVCLDSDDLAVPNAIERIITEMQKSGKDGIVAYKADLKGQLIGDVLPENVDCMHIPEMDIVYSCRGDYVFAYSTIIAQKYPFCEFPGERFVPESTVLDMLGKRCVVAVLPEILMKCEYQQDGYSQNANSVMAQNPSGFCLYFMQRIDLMPSFSSKLIHAGKYWCFRWISKNKTLRYTGGYPLICALGWLLGIPFWAYYKVVRGF